MKKKSLALAVIAVMMVASLATALTLAYFTDSKSAINTFTVGNVAIDLKEPAWPTGQNPTMKANPGVAVNKDPYVENTGKNAAYVRVDVVVSDADVFKQVDGTPYALFDANTGSADNKWTQVGSATYSDSAKTWTYTYQYNSVLQPRANDTDPYPATSKLFEKVMLPAAFTNANVAALANDGKDGFTVTVKASAIQVAGFETDAAGAFAELAKAI